MTGYIHSFESLAALDGAGLRCAVFFSGCPLRCVYCHNPDTWEGKGEKISPEDLVKKISRYKPYFKSGGGVTFSGGEPLLQAEFIKGMIGLLEREGIEYAIDTSGATELSDTVKEVLINAQMVLLDLKMWDADNYRVYTKSDIENPLKTLEFLESIGKRTWIRTVIVPGINDNEESIRKYANLVKGRKCVEKYELLGFHTMGFYKYDKLGIENPLKDKDSLDKEKLKNLQSYLDNLL